MCPNTKLWYFYHSIPRKYLVSDVEVQPRGLEQKRLRDLALNLRRNFQLSPTVCRLVTDENQIKVAIRKATIARQITPVILGSAFKNKGIRRLLDAVVDYLPSPEDVPPVNGHHPKTNKELKRKPSDDEPFSALAFKVATDSHVGKLIFFRVYSGVAKKGQTVINPVTGKKERLGRILRMHANKREDMDFACTGNIYAAVAFLWQSWRKKIRRFW